MKFLSLSLKRIRDVAISAAAVTHHDRAHNPAIVFTGTRQSNRSHGQPYCVPKRQVLVTLHAFHDQVAIWTIFAVSVPFQTSTCAMATSAIASSPQRNNIIGTHEPAPLTLLHTAVPSL